MSQGASQPGSVAEVCVAQVWALAWPAIAQASLVTLMFVADRALVGRHSETALAAMHVGATLSWTVISLFGAVAVGGLAVAGRRFGAGERTEAALASRLAVGLAGGLGALGALALWLGRRVIVAGLFPQAGAAAGASESYLAAVLPALPLGLSAVTAAACLHALRDTRTPLRAAVAGNVVNLVVSTALVFGLGGLPELGATGAGVGTACGFAMQAALLVRAIARLPIRRKRAWGPTLRELASLALPTLGERGSYHAAYLGYAALVATLGPTAMAAHQSLLGLEALSFSVAEGFAVAAALLAANHHGAGRPDLARRTTMVCLALAAVAATGATALMLLGGGPALSWLDPATGAEARDALTIAAAMQPFCAVTIVAAAALRGGGQTRSAGLVTLVGAVLVRLGATAWLLPEAGLRGAWLAAAADFGCQAALLLALAFGKGATIGPARDPVLT